MNYPTAFLIFINLLFASLTLAENMIIDDMTSVDSLPIGKYCENDYSKWCLVTDRVMGGVSRGSLTAGKIDNGYYLNLSGTVSTDNNGGFIQFRKFIQNHPKKAKFSGVRIIARGNGEEYAIHVKTKYLFLPWQYYYALFSPSSEWQSFELPFNTFAKSNIYQPLRFSSDEIRTIGIVAIGRDFEADIDVSHVEFYKKK